MYGFFFLLMVFILVNMTDRCMYIGYVFFLKCGKEISEGYLNQFATERIQIKIL